MYGSYDYATKKYKENQETIEILRTLFRINKMNQMKLTKQIDDFIAGQFKNMVGEERKTIEGFPLDLHEVIEYRSGMK
jgi:hypothetical protein